MAGEKAQKIDIGFLGGQVLSTRVAVAELARLREALPAGAWLDLTAEGGTVAIDLARVVYVFVDDEEHQVGFGT